MASRYSQTRRYGVDKLFSYKQHQYSHRYDGTIRDLARYLLFFFTIDLRAGTDGEIILQPRPSSDPNDPLVGYSRGPFLRY